MCLLDVLDLASHVSDDGVGNTTYSFETSTATAHLTHNSYDGDTLVVVLVPGQSMPIARISLIDCEGIKAVNDKRGKYLELVGKQSLIEGAYRDGKRTAGFRLHVGPEISLEPFLVTE